MEVLVIGVTGFLGSAVAARLESGGHQVTGASRHRGQWRGPWRRLDLVTAPAEELSELVGGAQAVVLAAGADDRTPAPRPVTGHFERELVAPTARLAAACAEAGAQRLVVLGSFFTALDRLHPHWRLAASHPYVRARQRQEEVVRQSGMPGAHVVEIPYLFGVGTTGTAPAWLDVFLPGFLAGPVPLAPRGSAAAAGLDDVAHAVVAAVEGSMTEPVAPIVTGNLTFADLVGQAARHTGRRRRVRTLPVPILRASLLAREFTFRVRGRESGLSPTALAVLLSADAALDAGRAGQVFGIETSALDAAIDASLSVAFPR